LPEPVAFVRAQRRASFTVSQNGILAYRLGVPTTQLTWLDRTGQRLNTLGSPGRYLNPAIAPDASRIAVTRLGPSATESDIWLFETHGERLFTSSTSLNDYPVWSPDGDRLVYSSNQAGSLDLYVKETAASSQESGTVVLKNSHQKRAMDWTPDGRQVVFLDSAGSLGPRLPMMFAMGSQPDGSGGLTLGNNPGASIRSVDQVQVSPDGHWLAYVSDVNGAAQVYVRQFPDGARRWQVSTDGGFEPKWRGDGRELFYIGTDQQMMSVAVNSTSTGFEASRPLPLFRTTVLGAPFQNGVVRNEYAVSRDGQRFLINEPIDGAAAYGIRVLANWGALLSAREPRP
jgi:Tol biopolymer transport system component